MCRAGRKTLGLTHSLNGELKFG